MKSPTEPMFICAEHILPLRAEPAHRAEMVSQALFGEQLAVLELTPDSAWARVRMKEDGYEGWAWHESLLPLDEAPGNPDKYGYVDMVALPCTVFLHVEGEMHFAETFLPAGSRAPLPAKKSDEMSAFHFGGRDYTLPAPGILRPADLKKPDAEAACGLAADLLDAPYLWGGRTVFGIDCSGLTQLACRYGAVKLPRDAHQQAECGQAVPIEEAKRGDLAFFVNQEDRITHVGLVLQPGQIIHASGRVRIDSLTNAGIWRAEDARLTHNLHSVRRIFT